MAVSNFYGTNALIAHAPTAGNLQQFRGFEREKHFDGHDLFVQDSRVTQVRARTFIGLLEQNLKSQEKNEPALGSFLKQILQLSDSEEDRQRLGEISQAFFKQRGYFSRLFSGESWEDWTENRTALGKVASQFKDYIVSPAQVSSFTKNLNGEVVRKANKEVEALLKSLGHRDATMGRSFRIESKHSCATGLVGGAFGSLLTQHPLPLLIGLSGCFPRVRAQQKVGSEFQVNNYTQDAQQTSSITSFQDGNFVVAWNSNLQDGSGFGVYGQIFNETGSKIGSEFRVNNFTQDAQQIPSITSFQDGNFVVTWNSKLQDSSGWGVYGQIFNGTGSKIGSEFQVNTYTSSDQKVPSVASLKSGDFVVTWQSLQDTDGDGIYGQIFDGAGSILGSEFQVNNYTQNNQTWPSVASLESGDFVVTWESENQDGNNLGVFGQLFKESGDKVGNEFQVNTYTAQYQGQPSVASFSNGKFVVTWMSLDQDGSSYGIYGQLFYGNGTKIGSEFQVNTEIVNSQRYPSVASLSGGHFIVTWSSMDQDGSSWGGYGQLFEGNTSRIGNEFQVNTYTNNDQGRSSVASLQNNNFVMTWNSQGQDGLLHGVYGQIFHDNFTFSSSSSSTSTSQTSSFRISSPTSSLSITSSIITKTITSNFDSSSSTRSSTDIRTTPSLDTSKISSEIFSTPSDPNNRLLWLWILLGVGGGTSCLGLTACCLFKSRYARQNKASTSKLETIELPPDDYSSKRTSLLSSKREGKKHTRIGEKYDLVNRISRKEAAILMQQTGIEIEFPEGKNRTDVVLGKGAFGKLRLAYDIENETFVGVKKIKGDKQIKLSKDEGYLQSKLEGKSNIMRILDFVESVDSNDKPVLYEFMPLAGFGNGEELRDLLRRADLNPKLKEKILAHVARGLLTGFSQMHKAHIYHLDMKPANMVFDQWGEPSIIDFGCAKELPDKRIREEMLGDTSYFSPERLKFTREIHSDLKPKALSANKEDAWAVGVSLLELAIGVYPFDKVGLIERLEKWDAVYFQGKLGDIPALKNPASGSFMAIVKGLLNVNPKNRLSIEQAFILLVI